MTPSERLRGVGAREPRRGPGIVIDGYCGFRTLRDAVADLERER